MAADTGNRLDVGEVLAFADGFAGVLRGSDDAYANAQVLVGARRLRSACRSESDDLERQLRDYQEKVCSCKENIHKAKAETIADDELSAMQNEMEEKFEEEKQFRQHLRATIEERKDAIKKKKKDMKKAENTLSMCVSVTNIMPNLEYQDRISSYIVDKNGKKIQKCEFEKTVPAFDICDTLEDDLGPADHLFLEISYFYGGENCASILRKGFGPRTCTVTDLQFGVLFL